MQCLFVFMYVKFTSSIVEIQRALLSLDEMQEVGIHYVFRTF